MPNLILPGSQIWEFNIVFTSFLLTTIYCMTYIPVYTFIHLLNYFVSLNTTSEATASEDVNVFKFLIHVAQLPAAQLDQCLSSNTVEDAAVPNTSQHCIKFSPIVLGEK